jgi:predicted DNA-binding transcriptional regulator AlpA
VLFKKMRFAKEKGRCGLATLRVSVSMNTSRTFVHIRGLKMVVVANAMPGPFPEIPQVVPETMVDSGRKVYLEDFKKVARSLGLGSSGNTIAAMIRDGKIPAPTREGHKLVWTAGAVRKWINDRAQKAAAQLIG